MIDWFTDQTLAMTGGQCHYVHGCSDDIYVRFFWQACKVLTNHSTGNYTYIQLYIYVRFRLCDGCIDVGLQV